MKRIYFIPEIVSLARLLTYIPGVTLNKVQYTTKVFIQVGELIATLTNALEVSDPLSHSSCSKKLKKNSRK